MLVPTVCVGKVIYFLINLKSGSNCCRKGFTERLMDEFKIR
jgi:hypothetical protein